MKRLLKQTSIIILALGIIAGIAFGIYYLLRDNEPVADTTPTENAKKDISQSEQALIKNNEKWDYVVYLENPNPDWALKKFNYLLTQDNKTLKIGASYLAPNEKKPLIFKNLNVNEDNKLELELTNYVWEKKKSDLGKTTLEIKEQDITEVKTTSGNKIIFQGVIQNKTSYNLEEIQVLVINQDDSDEINAINSSTIFNLEKNESRKFQVEWQNSIDLTPELMKDIEITVTSNFYDSDNFLDNPDGYSRQDR